MSRQQLGSGQRIGVAGWLMVTAVLSLLLSGCGSARSVGAYCAAMEKHKARYLSAMDQAGSQLSGDDPLAALGGLAGGVAAIGDLSQMWDELAEVAPLEIAPDVEKVRDTYADQLKAGQNSLSDPLQALGSQLAGGILASGSIARVDAWTGQNCG